MGKSKKTVIGYHYEMGVHMVLGHGPVDKMLELVVGERSAWTGNVTSSGSIDINQPELFGGEKREGGLVGTVDVLMGEDTQAVNPYMDAIISGPVPSYLGLFSLVFRGAGKGFRWSAMNPYFKNPWVKFTRVLKGWDNDTPWYPAKAYIGPYDMNPAHIIYECYTNSDWGMGYSPNDIDDANFQEVADTLYDEEFGLSLGWMQQTSVSDFVTMILRHIDGVRRYDIRNGKMQLKLIRKDYVLGNLPELNTANVITVEDFQRAVWGELANQITVKFVDREQNESTLTVQNLATVDGQVGLSSKTNEYPGIRESDLASRVAQRDLQTSSTALAKLSLVCNRVAWDWQEADVFRFFWPPLGIAGIPFRITKIDKGSLVKGEIRIEAVEDILVLPVNGYVAPPVSGWSDPFSLPQPLTNSRIVEAPYWDIVRTLSSADFDYLLPDWAFGEYLGVKPTSDAYNFSLQYSPSGGAYTEVLAGGAFVPSATLSASLPYGKDDVVLTLTGLSELSDVEVDNYAYIDDEIVWIKAINLTNSQVTVGRAILDSIPAEHAAGARLWFCDGSQAVDPTTRVNGETVHYKALTLTGRGTLSLGAAPSLNKLMVSRGTRPYPPGNVQVNGQYAPAAITGPLTVTWSHRDRTQQTAGFTAYAAGNIGPEPGTTYTVKVYNNTTLLRTYAGITGNTWTYPPADEVADGNVTPLRITLETVRDGYTSMQKHDFTFTRS